MIECSNKDNLPNKYPIKYQKLPFEYQVKLDGYYNNIPR